MKGLQKSYKDLHVLRTVISEAFNSNTLNLIAGLGLPALILGPGVPPPSATTALVWLAALSLTAIVVLVLQRGLTRTGDVVIIGLYSAFLAFLFRTALI